MSTIAELTIPADEFALRETLESVDDVSVEIERVVAHGPDHVMPYVWISGTESSMAGIDELLEEDPSVDESDLLTDLGDERLYRLSWIDDVTVIVHILTEEKATILQAASEGRWWQFRVLFPERESLANTYDFATEQGFSLDIQKIHQLDEGRQGRYGLTDAQYETLVAALEGGYYEIPRNVDMESLSNDLDISHQALSERLRRAHRSLVEEAVTIGHGEEDSEAAKGIEPDATN
ncbi:helix-turn-helix domain-containing protein [Halostagnicola sp. A-GB9-2]|uniref:helix-turn-helix domain-containing protein n=1 Tax=Halostagnicola sp. A-GB9-2 TaxID=3048066 RepID=UPI0024C07DB0|nr:helix-turn-helix domain-containing protein [Halostagnicola sp. A-GB9-2]MDJ1431795.1 helix-turn-helix domain-containing protein [Halostagnicola sp. A-GB9-2]